ncbi:MAG: mycofactocin-associated electron transfer flavoprotein beta subunit [Acidobacteriota bacterium]|nr:mycofactocin-associated electron transfer flavoprotein beta subunit [Acidobacteriota bacterium]
MNRAGPMVVVCVSPTDLRPEVDPLSAAVEADDRRCDLNAAEAAALEHGLRIAESWQGWVLVVCHGPSGADGVLRDLIGLGVEVVRVADADHDSHLRPARRTRPAAELAGSPEKVAAALARVIRRRGRPALVLCGDRSAATGVGAVPGLLAAELDLDQALGLVSVVIDGPGRLLVERRLDGGWRERLQVEGPAVLSVEGAGVRLRRARLEDALQASQAVVEVDVEVAAGGPPAGRAAADGGPAGHPGPGGTWSVRPFRPRTRPVPAPVGDPHDRLLVLTGALSNREPARVMGPLSPAQAADELLAYLSRRATQS